MTTPQGLDRAVEEAWTEYRIAALYFREHEGVTTFSGLVNAERALESAIAARACAPLVEAMKDARDALLGTMEWDHPAVRAIDRALAAHREEG